MRLTCLCSFFSGRGEAYRSGDLRERLERRRSPPLRRRSPARDFRNRPGYYDRNLSPRDRGTQQDIVFMQCY